MTKLLVALLVALAPGAAHAYLVAPALGLDKLAAEADVVVKAVARASRPVQDPWFSSLPGYEARETELEIVSVVKGTIAGQKMSFRHYAEAKDAGGAVGTYSPQSYELIVGQPYLVFAKRDGERYRQLWKAHRSKVDQGLWRAADARPVATGRLPEVVWNELVGLLASATVADSLYAMQQLDELSGVAPSNLKDFPRGRVLGAIDALLKSSDDSVVERALVALGSPNPCLDDAQAPFWLASLGPGLPGIGAWDRHGPTGAKTHYAEVLALATGHARTNVRARAIRALCHAEHPALVATAKAWTKEPVMEVRAAATLLLADFPGAETDALLRGLAKDAAAAVRKSAALAIGYGRRAPLVTTLGGLAGDREVDVQRAAAMTLLSFPVAQVREILKAQRRHPRYQALFVNALAMEDTSSEVPALVRIIRGNLQPEGSAWWGGTVPWAVSWNLLYQFARTRPAAAWASGELDEVLAALEAPATGRPAPTYVSSAEPRDLYALYLLRGQRARAAAFRATCKKGVPYDLGVYFDQVDANPKRFEREARVSD